MYFLLVIVCILLNKTVCWREASRCTTSGAVASADAQSSQNSNAGRTLKIDCNGDLIYIAWSHYGHRASDNNNNNILRSQLAPLLSNDTIDEGCYFSPKDCLVSVDYVANECNGLGSCQISLDAQYLHSCKSYSDYLFIVYECYPVRDTVDVCDEGYESQAEIGGGDDNDIGAVYYVKTPNYPNEYSNNLECNCSIRTQTYNDPDNGRQTMMEIEMLEFDLEGSSTNENDDNMASLVSYNLNTFSQQQPQLTGTGRRQFNNNNQQQMCTRDYFSVNVNKNLCGSLSPFATFYNLVSTKTTTKQPTNDSQHQITKLKFTSDDALTRRGFWMKLKISSNRKASCPDNFILINNICLRVYDQDMSWYEAHQFCTKQGYSLALIDNFELEKQLNKIIYDHGNDTILEGLFAFRKLVRNGPNGPVRKFWTGIRHLNETSWFDFKNELIKFRPDESNWWPWLIMDAATYSQGSCVAKRKNHFFLDDCYKRMPFACQAKPVESASSRSSSSGARTKVHFKCGKNSHIFEQPDVQQQQRSTIAAVQTSNVTKRAQSSPQFYSNEDANANRLEKIAQVNLDADNLRLPVKISASESNSSRNDSSILIGLVCAITLIIASINTAVIIIFCKKRKFLMKEQNNESTDKESKTSSQDTINRNHHLHHHTHHGDLNLLDDGTIIVGNLNNSLSYNCLTSTTTTNQKKPIFISAAASNNHHSNGHLNQSNSEGYNYLNNNFNQTNLRRSVFLTNTNDQNNRQLIANISSMAKTLAKSNTKLTAAASQPGQNNDPLSHIYETISVSSNMMDTPVIAAHHYNCRFNRNLLLEANNKNPYNELECDQPPSTYNDSSIATSTTNDSTSSHKSHDLFLINLDSINNNNKKSLSNKDFNNLMFKQHLQSQQQNQQLFAKYPATSSDVHHATMSNKYLLQRLQTNQLLLNNPNSINSNHLNFGHVTPGQQQTATTMYRTVNNQQQQHQQHFVDDFVDPQTVGDIFTSRIEAVV